jgi:hypothetical protein
MFESMTKSLIFLYDDVESINQAVLCERKQFR